MNFVHPLSKYGLAYVLRENKLQNPQDIEPKMLAELLERGCNNFRLYSSDDYKIAETVTYRPARREEVQSFFEAKKGAGQGVLLAPNVLTTDKQAQNAWKGYTALADKLRQLKNQSDLAKLDSATASLAPMSGKFNNGKKTQAYPKVSVLELACSAIAALTDQKPFLTVESTKPVAIIPDLPITELQRFISVFELLGKDLQHLFKVDMKTRKNQATYPRPKIYQGNFPDAPSSFYLKSLGLLAALGNWANKAEILASERADILAVLDSLKDCSLYLVSGAQNTEIQRYGHYIVELAKAQKLGEIIQGLYRSVIHAVGSRAMSGKAGENRYATFDFLAARFLQAFDRPSLRDFLSIRAEYSASLTELFNQYFIEQMKTDKAIVEAAQALGAWINRLAYKTASKEKGLSQEQMREQKAKILVELESAVASAKTPAALMAQLLTRAGRLSGQDAPAQAARFAEALLTGEINLDDAKNMLMAYARISTYVPGAGAKGELEAESELEADEEPAHDLGYDKED